MNYQVRIQKRKDFQILENNMPIIKGAKPKWYSSEIVFFFNNKTYQIKKKSFWNHPRPLRHCFIDSLRQIDW